MPAITLYATSWGGHVERCRDEYNLDAKRKITVIFFWCGDQLQSSPLARVLFQLFRDAKQRDSGRKTDRIKPRRMENNGVVACVCTQLLID